MMFPHVYKCTFTYAHTDGHAAHTRTHAHTHTSSYLRTPHNTQAHDAHTQCTCIGRTFTTLLSDGHGAASLE